MRTLMRTRTPTRPYARRHSHLAEQGAVVQVGGNMLWNARTGERFVMKGMTYGYTVEDSAEDTWKPALQNIANLNGKTPGYACAEAHSSPASHPKYMHESPRLRDPFPTPAAASEARHCCVPLCVAERRQHDPAV